MKYLILMALCICLTSCGLQQRKEFEAQCASSAEKMLLVHKAIGENKFRDIDAVEAEFIKPLSTLWQWFINTMRFNPNITADQLRRASIEKCMDIIYTPAPVNRSKEEQYCYDMSQTVHYLERDNYQRICNLQMKATRNYLSK